MNDFDISNFDIFVMLMSNKINKQNIVLGLMIPQYMLEN